PGDLSARRHPRQGRSRHHGGRVGGQGAATRSSGGAIGLEPAGALQGAAGKEQMAAAPGAGALRSRVPGRPAENGLRRADPGMDPRAVARLGGVAAGAVAARRRGTGAPRAGAAGMARAPRRHAQLAISVVDGADARGVAREVGLKVRMRPRRILHVITDLYLAGAETMLARLAAARPGLADETMVVSLLPDGFHTERLRAAGGTAGRPH